MTSPEERSLAAEVRAVESGKKAWRVEGDGTVFLVHSTSYAGKRYKVEVVHMGDQIGFVCAPYSADNGELFHNDHMVTASSGPGLLPCLHAGVVARSLESAGNAEWRDGRWFAAGALESKPFVGDPWEGL